MIDMTKQLPPKLKGFIKDQTWIFAKTYADTWPHEYIVQKNVDNDLFLEQTVLRLSIIFINKEVL